MERSNNRKEFVMLSLFAAILAVEGWAGPGTRGAAGEIGPYQITRPYWQDARMDHGAHEDCENPEYAREVMRRYWQRYCPIALRDRDYRTLAAVHHWGPKGARMAGGHMPDDYVARVVAIVEGR